MRELVSDGLAEGVTCERRTCASPIEAAKELIRREAEALASLAEGIDVTAFAEAIRILGDARTIHCSGVGKSGLVAHKMAATFKAIGRPAHYLDPLSALHGDLGGVGPDDAVVLISHSGRTDEMLRLLGYVKRLTDRIVSVVGETTSPLARGSACALSTLARFDADAPWQTPTSSFCAAIAIGDGLAVGLLAQSDSARRIVEACHPDGALGAGR